MSVEIPIFMVLAVLGFALVIKYLNLTRLGKTSTVVGKALKRPKP
ncbi:hypothetical protein [uncultured Desulfobacter sp.]|nr:hypothetical protein [uncultured Desulfobacter sp.]